MDSSTPLNIPITAQRILYSSWPSDPPILEPGDHAVIERIICAGGPNTLYQVRRLKDRRCFALHRGRLIECGAIDEASPHA